MKNIIIAIVQKMKTGKTQQNTCVCNCTDHHCKKMKKTPCGCNASCEDCGVDNICDHEKVQS